MTKETVKRLHKHYSNLVKGNFEESDFNFKLKGGEGGSMQMGEMSPERRELIKADAQEHKDQIEKAHPWLVEGEKKEENVLDKVAENKTQKKQKK